MSPSLPNRLGPRGGFRPRTSHCEYPGRSAGHARMQGLSKNGRRHCRFSGVSEIAERSHSRACRRVKNGSLRMGIKHILPGKYQNKSFDTVRFTSHGALGMKDIRRCSAKPFDTSLPARSRFPRGLPENPSYRPTGCQTVSSVARTPSSRRRAPRPFVVDFWNRRNFYRAKRVTHRQRHTGGLHWLSQRSRYVFWHCRPLP
jgi:hypothetical protein